jgi:hypothetical protein
MLGPVQVKVLRLLEANSEGMSIEELNGYWHYKQCGEKSIASLQNLGLIRLSKGKAYFQKFPEELSKSTPVKNYSLKQVEEFDDLSRRNLIYMYKDELMVYQQGAKPSKALPRGVRRSLQYLGILKWRIIELTDLGKNLLGEMLSKTTPHPQQASLGF